MNASPDLLLLAPNGQVGYELSRVLPALGTVRAAGRAELDLERPEAVAPFLDGVRPRIVVNASAYTAVDRAETEEAKARAVNADSVGELARWCAKNDAFLVHYSTDYVFGDDGDRFLREDNPLAPRNAYGRSKAEGERRIAASGSPHFIFRTSWVYAPRGNNFARTMIRLAGERDSLRVVADQWGAPTSASLIAEVTFRCLERVLESGNGARSLSGIYHLVAAGQTTWHGFATRVLKSAESRGVRLRVAPDRVEAIPSSAYPTPAARPLNSRLDTSKLRSTFGIDLPDWTGDVDETVEEMLRNSP